MKSIFSHFWLKFFVLITGLIIMPVWLPLPAQPLAFEQFTLENGIKVYYQHEAGRKISSLVFHFAGGLSLEKTGQSGLAYLTTRLMAEVTSESRLSELLASGVSLGAGSRPDYSLIQFEGSTVQLEKTLEIVAAGLKNPLFSRPRIDNVKRSMKLEAGKEATRLVDSALLCLRQKIFPGTPYSNSIYGQDDDLKALGRKDINLFYNSIINSGCLSLLIVTDLDRKYLQEILTRHLSWVKRGNPPSDKSSRIVENNQRKDSGPGCEHYRGPAGAAVVLGYVLPGELNETYPAAYLLERIIGGGPGSLIWRLRQEEGLAYNLNSRLEILGGEIIFICYMETEKDKVLPALVSLKQSFARLSQEGLGREAVEYGMLLARNSYLRESFSRDHRLAFLSLLLANDLSHEYYNNFLEMMKDVSPDRLNELIRASFEPDRAVEIIVARD